MNKDLFLRSTNAVVEDDKDSDIISKTRSIIKAAPLGGMRNDSSPFSEILNLPLPEAPESSESSAFAPHNFLPQASNFSSQPHNHGRIDTIGGYPPRDTR